MTIYTDSDTMENDDYIYPQFWSELSTSEKNLKAEELIQEHDRKFLTNHLEAICQHDFKLCSLVCYKLIADEYKDKENVPKSAHPDLFNHTDPVYMPVRYCGGDIVFGRVFCINHCAFSSPDSIIGFRNAETDRPQEMFKIVKGLRKIGIYRNWVLFKLDRLSTDDMTGMLYTPLEKNFTIEFAHFPHEGGYRTVYRWEDC